MSKTPNVSLDVYPDEEAAVTVEKIKKNRSSNQSQSYRTFKYATLLFLTLKYWSTEFVFCHMCNVSLEVKPISQDRLFSLVSFGFLRAELPPPSDLSLFVVIFLYWINKKITNFAHKLVYF
jgi:hypothetical protein